MIKKQTLKVFGIICAIIAAIIILQLLLTHGKGTNEINDTNSLSRQEFQNVEKIQVVHFHTAQQCWSCITIGKYAEKTIKDKFPEEYKDGKIEYLDINIDESQNLEIVKKYQAYGSSLYINAVSEGKDNITEDVEVWRLVSNEKKFISYFEDKLNSLIK